MADLQVSEDYRCGYCYQQFNSMTDPRELPCHHVFCLPCLEEDYQPSHQVFVRCRVCLSEHFIYAYIQDQFPEAKLSKEVTNSSSPLTCDCYSCDGRQAVSYCIYCAVKMCEAQQQDHSRKFGESHKVIPISTYTRNPLPYKKVICEQHHEKMCQVCEKCQLLVCEECKREEKFCLGDTTEHTFISLETLERKITANLKSVLASGENKLFEICERNGHMLKTYDEEEDECDSQTSMIDIVRMEQKFKIEEKSEQLKEEIYEIQDRLNYKVRSYNTSLMAKKKRLEESCTEIRKLLQESHTLEKMGQMQKMIDAVMENMNIEVDCPLIKPPVLIHTGGYFLEQPKHVALPTSLSLKYEHSTTDDCYSTTYNINGDLVLGCHDGVRVLKDGRSKGKECIDGTVVLCVQAYHNNIYILAVNGDRRHVYQCLPDMSKRKELFSVPNASQNLSCIAVSGNYIMAHNPDGNQLVLYSFCKKKKEEFILNEPLESVHFLPDENLLLVTSYSGTLMRRRLTITALELVWKNETLENACHVTSDADGLIYVSSFDTQTIYIVSPQGVMLKEIRDNNIPKHFGQLSIRGRDELAILALDRNSVLVFKINH